MFYIIDVNDYVRVEPRLFGLQTQTAIEEQLHNLYEDYHDEEIGEVIAVLSVADIGEGIIIPGDGAAYYNSNFKLLTWKPELQELVYGTIEEVTNFGAFINLGVMRGMIHISQTMEDYVSFSSSNTLSGRASKRVLKKGDNCLARIVALSFKGDQPKIGLTMRQPGLGKIEWVEEEKKKAKAAAKKMAKIENEAAKRESKTKVNKKVKK
jgi:DNA-directed RNA polymerase subunit E'